MANLYFVIFTLGFYGICSCHADSLAKILVWSMTSDGPILPPSGAATPFGWPEDKARFLKPSASKSYLAGCKALDSLARMILSTESFFHPSNSGSWTVDLSAFIKYLVSEFNKREYGSYRISIVFVDA